MMPKIIIGVGIAVLLTLGAWASGGFHVANPGTEGAGQMKPFEFMMNAHDLPNEQFDMY
jgi:hypothetical protein